ncbi:NUDIX domain-containing protein [Alkalicaulis satelles]|uniref:NUDIX domain-containing protein n=2 Tax=Alkalicaulis satelles TaxID=2609175 RepID=A0A5M6ZPE6_9PROT|nr:NUDIX domain-containing protein [Alkalicaulis satelles]
MWNGNAFSGTKIALICGSMLVCYQRDQKQGIPFPGLWDLPGGGREDQESPVECVIREVEEEFGLQIAAGRIQTLTRYESLTPAGLDTYFCAARVTEDEIRSIRFGSEGQRWTLMTIDAFLERPDAVPHLQARLSELMSRP